MLAALLACAAASAQTAAPAPGLSLTSAAFQDGQIIPDRYTQAAASPVSPPLAWANVPPGVVSFVLLAHDPDAAPNHGSGDMLHWLMFNIPGGARSLAEAIPARERLDDGSVQTRNGGGTVGYRGPGARAPGPYHHYTFELFALDAKLDLGPEATRADVLKAMDGHVLAKAADEGRFHR